MAIHLVVQVPFWHYERGAIISDPAEIDKVMEHHDKFVTRSTAPIVPFFEVKLTDGESAEPGKE
jgi:hypothetical protein